MPPTIPITINAVELFDPAKPVAESAIALSDRILKDLSGGVPISVSFSGVRGAASSYYNIVLHRIKTTFGVEILRTIPARIEWRFDSDAQRTIFDRSLKAILKAAVSP